MLCIFIPPLIIDYSAYTKCMKLSKWEDHQFRVIKEPQRTILRANKNAKSGKTLLLYGLGLCYFHFSNFLWAKKTFLEVLYRNHGLKTVE